MSLVSVVVPTHNRPEMLAEALASIRAQIFTDYEIIVVSNGESGEMRGRSQAVATLADARWFTLPEGNVSAARNFGIDRAKGVWIAFLDDDDLWLPEKLERQLAEAQHTGADLIVCDGIEFFMDGRENVMRMPECPNGWTFTKAINHHRCWALPTGTLVRKWALDAVGGYDPAQRYIEDIDLVRRVSWNHSIHSMRDILFRHREGHPRLTEHEHECFAYQIRHLWKMRRDTPAHLRHTLPSLTIFIPPLIGLIAPARLITLLHALQPRRRWFALMRRVLALRRAIGGGIG